MIALIENGLMIAVKKLLIFQFNVRATGWWIASYSFSFFMFVKDIGMYMGKLLVTQGQTYNLRNSMGCKIFVILVSTALYFGVIFGFSSPSNRFGYSVNIMAMIEEETGIWFADYSKEDISRLLMASIVLMGCSLLVFCCVTCYYHVQIRTSLSRK